MVSVLSAEVAHEKPKTLVGGSLACHSGFAGGSDSKESACNAGDLDSVAGLGRSSGEGNDYLLQYSCLENSVDRGACWATVLEVAKSQRQLSDWH